MEEKKHNVRLKQNETLIGIYDAQLEYFPEVKIAVIKTQDGLRTEPVPNPMEFWQLPKDFQKP